MLVSSSMNQAGTVRPGAARWVWTVGVLMLFLGLTVTAAEAQEGLATLTGRVVDAETGSALSGASVQLIGRRETVTTGIDGSFSLPAVRVEDVTLVLQRLGYYPLRVQVQLEPAEGASITLQDPLPMRPLPFELDELVVEADDPWIEEPFRSKSAYRRERLVSRAAIERMPYNMDRFLDRATGAAKPGCDFEFYVDGRWVSPFIAKEYVFGRAPIEFETVEVYYANARMGARESPTAGLRGGTTRSLSSSTVGRDLRGMPCGVIRFWSLGHREVGERQHVGEMVSDALGPLAAGMGEVRGVVLGPDGRPVAGVLLTLIDEKAVPFAAGVTDAQGRYVLRVRAPGEYVLVGVRPGFPEWNSDPFPIDEGEVVDVTPRDPSNP